MERSSLGKRKAPLHNLQRRVRARKYEPEPEDVLSEEESSEDNGSQSEQDSEEDVDDSELSTSDEEEEEDDDADNPAIDASQVSFGALARAQATLSSVRRKKGRSNGEGEDDNNDDDSNNSEPEEAATTSTPASSNKKKEPPKKIGRTSKHAPAEQSSKRRVGRKREVVAAPRVAARDPRFDPLVAAAAGGGAGAGAGAGPTAADEDRARRAYAFLDEYRETEMARLKEALRQAKAVARKKKGEAGAARAVEELKRSLASMQGRQQARRRRDEEQALLAGHRRREKELVRQGRKSAPFYLKRGEQRRRLLVDRFAGMGAKEVDRTIERRRKKLASKERREIPMARRERS